MRGADAIPGCLGGEISDVPHAESRMAERRPVHTVAPMPLRHRTDAPTASRPYHYTIVPSRRQHRARDIATTIAARGARTFKFVL